MHRRFGCEARMPDETCAIGPLGATESDASHAPQGPCSLQEQVSGRRAICNRHPRREANPRAISRHEERHGACLRERPETTMADLLLILATAAFFALSWGYARLCEKL